MKFLKSRVLLLGLLSVLPAAQAFCGAPASEPPSFKNTLSEAGLAYGGVRPFITGKDYRRGSWTGARPAFWTLLASDGPVRLRLELTKNITPAQAEKTMTERFLRIDALYSGGAAYPGMVTTEFEVPPQLRPKDLRTGPGERKIKVLAATPRMTYGAGSEDLISYRGLLGYVYCGKGSMLAQIELFYPKAGFKLEDALKEFDQLVCASPGGPAGNGKPAAGGK